MKREIAQINDNPEIQIEEHAAKRLKSDLSEIKFLDASGLELKQLIVENDPELIAQKFDYLKKLSTKYKVQITDPYNFKSMDLLQILAYIGFTEAISKLTEMYPENGIHSMRNFKNDSTPLMAAAMKGHMEVVKLLLDKGVNVNEYTSYVRITPLMFAVKNGHKEIVKLLLDRGANIEAKDRNGKSLLDYAAKSGNKEVVELLLDRGATIKEEWRTLIVAAKKDHQEVVKLLLDRGANIKEESYSLIVEVINGHNEDVALLLDRGANIEAKDIKGWTPLIFAAKSGNKKMMELLLDRGADIEVKDIEGWTPLIFAAKSGNKEVVELLLDRGANIEAKDRKGKSLLDYAAKSGNKEMVELLLNRGANIKEEWRTLIVAAKSGNKEVVELLLDRGANIDEQDDNCCDALIYAAMNGHKEIVGLLLDRGANIKGEWYSLIVAAKRGHKEVVKLLLDKGADIEEQDYDRCTSLIYAAMKGHKEVVALLLDRGAKIDGKEKEYTATALMYAAMKGQKEVVALLLDKGADIKKTTYDEETSLDFAIENGQKEVVELLLDRGVNRDYKGSSSPLMQAAYYGCKKIVELMLDRGANLEFVSSENGETSLMVAANRGHKEVVALLLDRGADIEAKDEYGRTPLMHAIELGKKEVIELLLHRGADIEAKDEYGRTPLMFTAIHGHINALEMLIKSGADIDCKLPNGKTLSSFATERGHTEIVKLIETYKLAKNAAEKKCDITTIQEAINTDKIEIDKFINFLNFFIEKTGSTYAKRLIKENNNLFRDVADLIWKHSLSKQYKELKAEKLCSLLGISSRLKVLKNSNATDEQSELLSELPEGLKEYIDNPEALVKAYFAKDSTLPSINFIEPYAMNEVEWQMFCEPLQRLILPKELKQSTNEYIAQCNAIIYDPKTKAINESHLMMIERLEQVDALKSKNEELEKKILEHDIIMKEAATLAKENHELRGKVGVIEKQYSELFSVLGKLLAGKNQEANSDFEALKAFFPQNAEADSKPMDIIGDSSLNYS
jgi:ankyrin repeat protein